MTVFSAPDYPQFQALRPGEGRTANKAAAAVLTAPAWDAPEYAQWDAALPRPEVRCACARARAGVFWRCADASPADCCL